MTDIETLKWFWGRASSSAERETLLRGVAGSADAETLKWFWGRASTSQERSVLLACAAQSAERAPNERIPGLQASDQYDVFISHASEDKDSFVRGLATELTRRGVKVWYDEFTLSVGDSLRRSIDLGLAKSRFGVVVLSRSFFAKEWPQKELDGLVAREDGSHKIILPIWHDITKSEVARHSPMLADRVALTTRGGLERVVDGILQVLGK